MMMMLVIKHHDDDDDATQRAIGPKPENGKGGVRGIYCFRALQKCELIVEAKRDLELIISLCSKIREGGRQGDHSLEAASFGGLSLRA